MLPFRGLSQEDIKAQRLPLPPISHPGFKGHAINMLVLNPRDEGLRATLFWNMLGNLAIFDNDHNALEYRKHLVQQHQAPPNILCYNNGLRINSRGPIDQRDKYVDTNVPHYIWGAPHPKETENYASKRQGLKSN